MTEASTNVYTRRAFLRMALIALPIVLCPSIALAGARRRLTPAQADLSFLSSRLRFFPRSAWTRYRPKPNRLTRGGFYSRLTIHHTGTGVNLHMARSQVARDIGRILAAHTQLNYGDIGYHFVVDYSGCVWEARSLMYEGAHVSGANDRNIGIALLGNFEKQQPSVAQLGAMRQLVKLLAARYRINPSRFYGHRDLGHSLCPGRYLYPFVTNMRRMGV